MKHIPTFESFVNEADSTKMELYQEFVDSTSDNHNPKMSLTKTPGGFLIAQKSFGAINFKTMEDAESGVEALLKAGWPIKVMVKSIVKGVSRPKERKTVKSIIDNFFIK